MFPVLVSGLAGDSLIGPLFFFLCIPIPLLGGIVCMVIGLRGRKTYKEYVALADLLKAYRRIGITEIARKMQISEFEAEKRIAKVVALGLVEGYFDRFRGEFFTLAALGQELRITDCPSCGAGFEKIHLVGEHLKCSYCSNIVTSVRRM
jgi:hypothetical protein